MEETCTINRIRRNDLSFRFAGHIKMKIKMRQVKYPCGFMTIGVPVKQGMLKGSEGRFGMESQ